MSKEYNITMTIHVEDTTKSEMISKKELIEWIQSQYWHAVTSVLTQEAIIYHNSALNTVIKHINGDD